MTALALSVAVLLSQAVPAEPQRAGDPVRGYDALVNGGHVRCGVPWSLYREGVGAAPEGERLPGRRGLNAKLPYYVTAARGRTGETVVAANCLSCHAGWLGGRFVIGLGDASLDQTFRVAPMGHVGSWFTTGAARAELGRFLRVMDAVESRTVTDTLGVSSADKLAALLMAHRDPVTLAWRDEPGFEAPERLAPVKVPAWWLMRRKTAMFFTGSGRGDHARLMMASALLCTDDVKEAEDIDRDFGDVRAYIASLRPPRWPHELDAALAAAGAAVYAERCEKCHGAADPDGPYPNKVVPARTVGTDPLLAEQNLGAEGERRWFAGSFFGKTARLEATGGYVAPPMDGVWARAPYLHNGSVPTLAALLDSRTRPKAWTRSFRSSDDDPRAVGWRFRAVKLDPAHVASSRVYDTTRPGYSAAGHTYGDSLEPEQRAALLEFLKTL